MRSAAAASMQRIGPATPARMKLRGETSAYPQPAWLTAVVANVVHAVRGRVKVIAAAVGVPESAVYGVADPNHPQSLKAWWIPAIVQQTGSYAILDALEAQVGRVAFRLPETVPGAMDALHEGLGRTLRDVGVFVEKHGAALKDGRLDRTELAELRTLIQSTIAGLCEYEQLAIARAASDMSRSQAAR